MRISDDARARGEERYRRLKAEAQWSAVEGDENSRLRIELELERLWELLYASEVEYVEA